MALPAAGVRDAGEPVRLRGDARVAMPGEVAGALASGGSFVAFAILRACTGDGECLVRNSGELHLEDGRAFLPDEYQVHLREKWGASRPDLFSDVVVSGVIDMKGQ